MATSSYFWVTRKALQIHWNFNACTVTPYKSLNWCSKTLQSDQNEVQTSTWSHSNQEITRKAKPNENFRIYNVFERLGHHESANFPIKNHQKSCLQSKHAFWHPKSQKISKSDQKLSPMGDPKSIKNRLKFTLGHPRVLLSAPLQQMTAKVMPKCLLRTSKCSKNGFSRPLKINKCVCNRAWS